MASNLARAAIDHFGINNNKEREEKKVSRQRTERHPPWKRVINGSSKLNKVTLGIKAPHTCVLA
jgi:hypothetical protein